MLYIVKEMFNNGSTLTRRGYAMESINHFASNVKNVIAVKAGKGHKVIAEMKDGSEVVLIEKSGNLKPFVNVFDVRVNNNALINTTSRYCTFNNKEGVKALVGYRRYATPIASFQITEAA
jgi:hypothetical protein